MKRACLFAMLVGASFASNADWVQFNKFMVDHDKVYDSPKQLEYRFKVFTDNLDTIAKMNAEHIAINGQEVFGINSFADMTPEEFGQRLMKTLKPKAPSKFSVAASIIAPGATATVDWRNLNVAGASNTNWVTPVKDQGQCGSCWAHSADEAMESFYALAHKVAPYPFSVQQCTACTYTYNGCNGGWPHDAYPNAIYQRNGIDSDSNYPYNINQAGNCRFGLNGDADAPVANCGTGVYSSPAKGSLQNVLDPASTAATHGPVSVCVAAEAWQFYTNGVLSSCPGSVDHCVQAVGYNTGGDYWLVRNSWGTSWGQQGYIYLNMTTDKGDICHIQEYMTFPVSA